MGFTKRGPTSDARIWLSMKLKGLFMRLGNSFLFNSVHLWTVPLSFTVFMADYTHSFIMRLKSWHIKGYYQKRQVTYCLINSLLLLKALDGSSFIWLLLNSSGKDIPWFQLKVLLFRNCCYCKFLILFFCWINSLFMSRPIKHMLLL